MDAQTFPFARRAALGLVLGAAALALPARADAQIVRRLNVRGEFGLGAMLPRYQTEQLGYGLAVEGAARFGITLVGPLALQVSFASAYFPAGAGAGQIFTVTGGARFEPRVSNVGRFWVDGNLGAAFTHRARFAFDVGLGFEFNLGRYVGLGPFVRYGHVVAAPPADHPSHAMYLVGGISMTVRFGDPDHDPRRDDDGDRVRNADDECPDEPEGLHPDPRRRGCPMADRDGDNVPDDRDACNNLAGSPHEDRARNGCPGHVVLERGQLRIDDEIRFRANSDEIDPTSRAVLDDMADAMRAEPGIRRVSVDGHTDDTGEADVNERLSEQRAQAVRRYLIEHGVAANRLEAHGYGESRPRVSGTSEAARAANRRVEFRITDPAP